LTIFEKYDIIIYINKKYKNYFFKKLLTHLKKYAIIYIDKERGTI